MNPQTADIDAKYRTMMILWFVLLLTQAMFIGMLFSVKRELFSIDTSQPALGEQPLIIAAFAVLAVINLVLSFVMRNRAIEQAIAERKPAYVQTGVILGCAFCESISLLGLLLAFVFSYPYFFVWFAVGIIGIFLHFPRRQHLLDAAFGRDGR